MANFSLPRGGDTPHMIRGVQKDYKRLYYSEQMAALRVPVSLQAGYGVIEQGTVMALNKSAAGNIGKLVPYNPTTFAGGASENHPGRAYLVAQASASAYDVYVSMDDSYKFAVGDDLVINGSGDSAENLGAITAIDRTTYTHMAKITFTTALSGTFTIAELSYVCVEAGDNTNNYSDAVGILEITRDTGLGQYAKGAGGLLILGNCVLYEGVLTNLDSAAKTDLSAASFGQYLYIR
ncbi:hypothetical protein E2P64_06885 [Candidatus Bathyarchaeota archaeon]|nr:hypothetical protein E2P64_06885 [Candidatus Bathyarchaeota archaeon]